MYSQRTRRVGVVGGGVVGLSAALRLAEQHRDLSIVVVSDRHHTDTTSFGPAGLFRPIYMQGGPLTRKDYEKCAVDMWDHITTRLIDDPSSGAQYLSGSFISDNATLLDEQLEEVRHVLPHYHKLNQDELDMHHCPNSQGLFYMTANTEGKYYVPWLIARLKERGCTFERRHLTSLNELSNYNLDYVIHSSGLGAKTLVDDKEMQPMRGVLRFVKAPWVKHFFFKEADTYVFPGRDCVTMGGVKQLGRSDLEITDVDRHGVIERCTRVLPSLKHAEFVGEWAGLRPHRNTAPRVELDQNLLSNGKTKVIHNYGHGIVGFTLSWGSAVKVADIFDESNRDSSKL